MWPLIAAGAGLSALTALALYKVKGRKGIFTAEKRQEFDNAMSNILDSTHLRDLAAKFNGEGLTFQAEMLRKRANLRDLPEDVKRARRDVTRRALKCRDKDKVLKIAEMFEKEGATGNAAMLRQYADGLE